MPELPEVENVVRCLQRRLPGRRIAQVIIRWPRLVASPEGPELAAALQGREITGVRRRGKFVVLDLSPGGALLIHLRMTGQLLLEATGASAMEERHMQAFVHLDDGSRLLYRDVRKFGRFRLVRDADESLAALGPEPLSPEFTAAALFERLRRRRRRLKPLLLDQAFVAGLGNIYVDEALWRARLHPLRRADTLAMDEAERLHAAIGAVLQQAIANGGTTLRDYRDPEHASGRNREALAVYGRGGEPCPRCGGPVRREVIGGRGTHYCPQCQPAPGEMVREGG